MEISLLGSLLLTAILVLMYLQAKFSDQRRALARLESKLDALLQSQGVAFSPYSDIPDEILNEVRAGRKVEAIKLYRQRTGVGLKEASAVINALEQGA